MNEAEYWMSELKSARRRTRFILLFTVLALVALLPPLLLLRRRPDPGLVWAPGVELSPKIVGPVDQPLSIVGGSPAVYCVPAVGRAPLTPVAVFYIHGPDELVIGCACDRCQRFVKNP